MPDFNDLNENVSAFIDTYKILTPGAKAVFEAQINKNTQNMDDRTKSLYQALKQAAKDGLTAEEAIEKMERSIQNGKTNKPGQYQGQPYASTHQRQQVSPP